MRQMTDEMDQLPTILPAAVISACMVVLHIIRKGRHGGEAHAIFDNPEQFPVAQVLRRRFAQVRGLWIKAATDRRVSAAIVSMTNGAMIGKVQPRFALYFG